MEGRPWVKVYLSWISSDWIDPYHTPSFKAIYSSDWASFSNKESTKADWTNSTRRFNSTIIFNSRNGKYLRKWVKKTYFRDPVWWKQMKYLFHSLRKLCRLGNGRGIIMDQVCWVGWPTARKECKYWIHSACAGIYYPTTDQGVALDKWAKMHFFCPKHMPRV